MNSARKIEEVLPMSRKPERFLFAALLCFVALGLTTAAYGQGRGGGGGGGLGGGGGKGGGPPGGVGVDRGLGKAAHPSKGKSGKWFGKRIECLKGRSHRGVGKAPVAAGN